MEQNRESKNVLHAYNQLIFGSGTEVLQKEMDWKKKKKRKWIVFSTTLQQQQKKNKPTNENKPQHLHQTP